MDYVMAALVGLRSDDYVPNTMTCANDTKYFTIDYERFMTKWEESLEPLTLSEWEDLVFNASGALSGYLPDAIYYCYFLP
jgi:hypothetical protein